ncbi:hypothetical protein F7725_026652, partial [Dissostichus mawsoni]
MFLSESEDELEELHSDLDSESECSLDEEEYVPGGLARGSDQDDFSDEDSSDEEWASKPKRKVSRKRCCSVTASPVSSPLKSPSRKQEVSPCRKKLHYASTPKKDTSTPNSGKTLSSPRGKNKSGKPAEKKVEDDVDGDRWCNIDEEDVEPLQPRFRPDRDVGPQLNRTANYTPLELFQLFFSMTVINTLVKNTNAYGKNKYQGQKESWVPVTTADMYSFICLVLYMGIVPLKTLKEFWRGSKLFSLPFPASVMPCRRFLAISRSLHMNDPAVEMANEQKKGTSGTKRNAMPEKTPRGTLRWIRKGRLLFVKWLDTREVTMCSTLHKAYSNEMVKRKKNFREQLIVSLAEIGSTPRRSGPQNFMLPASPFKVPPASPSIVPANAAPCPSAELPDAPGVGHLPAYFVEQMTNVAPKDRATAGRRACVVCKRKSPVYCSTCQKTLCFTTLRNCY